MTSTANLIANLIGNDNISPAINNIMGTMVGLNQSLELAKKAIRALGDAWEFAFEGAQIKRIEDAGDRLAASYGQDMGTITKVIQEASGNTITEFDAMTRANNMMLLGIARTPEQFRKITSAAVALGRATGRDANQSIIDITAGIGRMSKKMLDNLGITYDANTEYRKFADSIGKSVGQLTELEKKQALVNVVLRTAAPLLDEEGNAVADVATEYEQLAAHVKDYFNDLKTSIADFLEPMVEAQNDAIDEQELWREAVDRGIITQEEYLSWWHETTEGIQGTYRSLEELVAAMEHWDTASQVHAGEAWEIQLRNTKGELVSLVFEAERAARSIKAVGVAELEAAAIAAYGTQGWEEAIWRLQGAYREVSQQTPILEQARTLAGRDRYMDSGSSGSTASSSNTTSRGYSRVNHENNEDLAQRIGEVIQSNMIRDAQMLEDIRRMLRGLPMVIRDVSERTSL